MVDAKRIKIIPHLREAPLPPRKTIVRHTRPVVGREAPVLAFRRERIRRRASLHVQVIKLRLLPRIRAVPVHADGDVAFHDEAAGTHMRRGLQ